MNDAERVVVQGFDAWNAQDVESFVRDHVHPDVLLVDAPDLPDAGEHRGISEFRVFRDREAALAEAGISDD